MMELTEQEKEMLVFGGLHRLLANMKSDKMVLEWAVHRCDEVEKQNIIWMDCKYQYRIEELEKIIEVQGSARSTKK